MEQTGYYFNRLPRIAQIRALQVPVKDRGWIARLDQVVEELAIQWKILPGDVLHGGAASLIIDVTRENGDPAVLKIALPGSSIHSEASVLAFARGRGYIQLYEADHERGALLLEKAGAALSSNLRTLDEHMSILSAVLKQAWVKPDLALTLQNTISKAAEMKTVIDEKWAVLNKPFSRQTYDLAMEYIKARIDSFDPGTCVLVHGDAHGFNILEGKNGEYKLIDPDGILADKGLDLICIMRDWSDDLLEGDTLELLLARCSKLSELTGADATSIWQWGYLARLVIGLTLLELGNTEVGHRTLEVADRVSHHRFF